MRLSADYEAFWLDSRITYNDGAKLQNFGQPPNYDGRLYSLPDFKKLK